MRVLVVHNRYSSRVPSGENLAVDDEVRWLRDAGVEVVTLESTNDDVVASGLAVQLRTGIRSLWSTGASDDIGSLLDEVRPDIVHVHNLFPLFTASVPATARRRGLPVVWTVHNFRVRCVAGTRFRDGRPCDDCRPGWRIPGVVHRCYGDSVPASALVGTATSIFRGWARRGNVTAVGISHEMGRWLVDEAGFPPHDVRVKHNGVAVPPTSRADDPAGCSAIAYVGRLTREKGVDLLLDAWHRVEAPVRLRFVGGGDLERTIERAAADDPRIELVGSVPSAEVGSYIAGARAVVVPSVWTEPFGRVAAEALAHGRAVVTTGHGALGEIVDPSCGWITGSDVDRLARALEVAATDDDAVRARGAAARERHRAMFAPEPTTQVLLDIYRDALRAAGRRTLGPG